MQSSYAVAFPEGMHPVGGMLSRGGWLELVATMRLVRRKSVSHKFGDWDNFVDGPELPN